MKKLALIILLCLPLAARAQNSAYSDIVLSGQGRPIAGAQVSVCSTPGLATTAASVTSNIAILTFGSSPITAGFVAGMTLQVSGFTGGDTYYNGGTLSGGVITGGFTILSVTSTTVTYSLVHANAAAGTNGSAFQQGNSVNSCAPLASITSDSAGANPITQPGFTTDGLGNYAFYAIPGGYTVQFSGTGIVLKLKPVNIACLPGSTCVGTNSLNTFTVLQTFNAGLTSAGPNTLNGGGSLAGTYTGNPTFSGNPLFSGGPIFNGTPQLTGNLNASGGTISGFPNINGVNIAGTIDLNGNAWVLGVTAPTISSGFGTSPSIPNNNGSPTFTINVGGGGAATTGVINMGLAAPSGWNVVCQDITTFSTTVFVTREISTTTTLVTIGNFNNSAVAAAWAANDILSCIAFAR